MHYLIIDRFNEVVCFTRLREHAERLAGSCDTIVAARHAVLTRNSRTRGEWHTEGGSVYPAPKVLHPSVP
jgi:hypothetical protein